MLKSHMRFLKYLPFILIGLASPASFAQSIHVVEIFTSAGNGSCVPHNSAEHESIEYQKSDVVETFDTLIKDYENTQDTFIALNYYFGNGDHAHDEEGNDIPIENPTDPKLLEFVRKRQGDYYKEQDFLDRYVRYQMVVDGIYKMSGTKIDTAEAALNYSKSEQSIQPIKLKLKDNNLAIELPALEMDKDCLLYTSDAADD